MIKADVVNMVLEITLLNNINEFDHDFLTERLPYSRLDILSAINYLCVNNILDRITRTINREDTSDNITTICNDIFRFKNNIGQDTNIIKSLMWLNIDLECLEKLKQI